MSMKIYEYEKVFLGGTCNNSLWREELIPQLSIKYFNPVVENWTLECQEEELRQRKECDYCLYCITPKMTGVYSIAEVVDDSNKRPDKTIIVVLNKDKEDGKKGLLSKLFIPDYHEQYLYFTESQRKSLRAVQNLIQINGGKSFDSLKEVAEFLNKHF